MSCQERQLQSRWQGYIRVVLPAYRILAFAIAAAQIFVIASARYSLIPPLILVTGVGIYTLVKVLHPLRWHQTGILGYSILGADIAVCIFLVISTGGLYSPFLLYTLAPVLTAALLLEAKVTLGIAGLSGVYVIGSHVGNPFFPTQLSLAELGYFLTYIIAVCLAAFLPYLINVNLRQHLQSEDILQERRRLSREIHDGSAQTLAVLCWQVELLRRRLAGMNIDLAEVRELGKLAEKARQDTREGLKLLRNYTGDGRFLPRLRDYLEHLKQNTDIDFSLGVKSAELHLEAPVELELLRICQEALTNIRKHAGARNVQIKLKQEGSHFEVSIADDGCGFDAIDYYRDGVEAKGHGLAVMQERAESIGGRFRVLSMPGQGTEIQVEVPANLHRERLLWLNR